MFTPTRIVFRIWLQEHTRMLYYAVTHELAGRPFEDHEWDCILDQGLETFEGLSDLIRMFIQQNDMVFISVDGSPPQNWSWVFPELLYLN